MQVWHCWAVGAFWARRGHKGHFECLQLSNIEFAQVWAVWWVGMGCVGVQLQHMHTRHARVFMLGVASL